MEAVNAARMRCLRHLRVPSTVFTRKFPEAVLDPIIAPYIMGSAALRRLPPTECKQVAHLLCYRSTWRDLANAGDSTGLEATITMCH